MRAALTSVLVLGTAMACRNARADSQSDSERVSGAHAPMEMTYNDAGVRADTRIAELRAMADSAELADAKDSRDEASDEITELRGEINRLLMSLDVAIPDTIPD